MKQAVQSISFRKEVEALRPYPLPPSFSGKNIFRCASNESPYFPPSFISRGISSFFKTQGMNRYPLGGEGRLIGLLSSLLHLPSEAIILGNGSTEILDLACRAILTRGKTVLAADWTFPLYARLALLQGAKTDFISRSKGRVGPKDWIQGVRKTTKLIFLGNPDNPSGEFLSMDKIQKILKGISSDILLVLDQAYIEYLSAKEQKIPLGFIMKHPNLLITRTFSKAYGLAGLRVGYGMGHPDLIERLKRCESPFTINCMALEAARLSLTQRGLAGMRKNVKKTLDARRKVEEGISKMGFTTLASQTNFFLLKSKKGILDFEFSKRLQTKGIYIRPLSPWGLLDTLRVTAPRLEDVKEFLKRFEAAVQ